MSEANFGAPPSFSRPRVPQPFKYALPGASIAAVLPVLLVFGALWVWFGWRIEPESGQIAMLMRKTGSDLPVGQIVADKPGQKGVQIDVLPEGRFFRNPYVWDWVILPAIDIPAGKFGVLVRRFGNDLPDGSIIATSDTSKGIVREVLGTGKHRINPYAYEVRIYDDIKIAPGHIGVVTSLCGEDILKGNPSAATDKGFLVGPEAKGVQRAIIKEGTHRLNPFLFSVSIVNIQSQRLEFNGADAITFLTLDGFPITVEGTLEFNISVDKASLLTHEIGDMEDIKNKLILPSARGFSRIEGSKKSATEFIVGESRQAFQNSLETYLKTICSAWGISINSVLIRDIIPPQEIAEIIRDRELASQDSKKIEQQIVQAQSQAQLEGQKALAEQNRLKVAAETDRIRQDISAQQFKVERTVAARTELAVATIALDTATADAQARLTNAEADRKVVEARNKTESDVLKRQVSVYRDETDYIRAKLYEKTAPKIASVLTADKQDGLMGLPIALPSAKSQTTPATTP